MPRPPVYAYQCPRCGARCESELPHARFAHQCPAARGREIEWRPVENGAA